VAAAKVPDHVSRAWPEPPWLAVIEKAARDVIGLFCEARSEQSNGAEWQNLHRDLLKMTGVAALLVIEGD
jgi:hypothetical protein